MKRHAAREKAFQLLFQLDLNDSELRSEDEEDIEQDEFLQGLIKGVKDHRNKVDMIIAEHLQNWSLSRIAIVEKTILRIATYEIHYLEEVPTKVSINEAIELAHEYGDEKSGKFVNGVLSRITQHI